MEKAYYYKVVEDILCIVRKHSFAHEMEKYLGSFVGLHKKVKNNNGDLVDVLIFNFRSVNEIEWPFNNPWIYIPEYGSLNSSHPRHLIFRYKILKDNRLSNVVEYGGAKKLFRYFKKLREQKTNLEMDWCRYTSFTNAKSPLASNKDQPNTLNKISELYIEDCIRKSMRSTRSIDIRFNDVEDMIVGNQVEIISDFIIHTLPLYEYFYLNKDDALDIGDVDETMEDKPYDVMQVQKQSGSDIMIDKICDYIRWQGYTFRKDTVVNYYASLKTKPFVILTGISGTGKTKLTQLFAQAIYGKASDYQIENVERDYRYYYRLIPVRPDWTDPRFILGFYNSLTGKYERTPFLDILLKASEDQNNAYFVCLDEMNLAHVEHYFATFLSAMESGEEINLHAGKKQSDVNDAYVHEVDAQVNAEAASSAEDVVETHDGFSDNIDGVPKSIKCPPNLFFIGTVNIDETTHRFSPKVLDRANTIEVTIDREHLLKKHKEAVLSDEPKSIEKERFNDLFLKNIDDESIKREFDEWDKATGRSIVEEYLLPVFEILEPQRLHFGFRTRDEILRYLFWSRDILDEKTALDFQMLQKVLPKIKGGERIKSILEKLSKLMVGKGLTRSERRLKDMLEQLDEEGYAEYQR
jgi:energy-coupling factor transporter ATP-binding protein EcfA2